MTIAVPNQAYPGHITTDTEEYPFTLTMEANPHRRDWETVRDAAARMYKDLGSRGMHMYLKVNGKVWSVTVRHPVGEDAPIIEPPSTVDRELDVSLGGTFVVKRTAAETFNAETLSVAELDHIAVFKQGVLGKLKKGSSKCRGDVDNLHRTDWGFKWINDRGMTNTGTLILRPLGKRTKILSVIGRAVNLIDQYGFDRHVAQTYVRASHGERHAQKHVVITAVSTMKDWDIWDHYQGNEAWFKKIATATLSGLTDAGYTTSPGDTLYRIKQHTERWNDALDEQKERLIDEGIYNEVSFDDDEWNSIVNIVLAYRKLVDQPHITPVFPKSIMDEIVPL